MEGMIKETLLPTINYILIRQLKLIVLPKGQEN